MKTTIIIFAAVVALAGCVSNPGVVQISGNTYIIARSSAAGAFADTSMLKIQVIQEANRFAESQGKIAVAKAAEESMPAHGFPSFTYEFLLLDKDDPRARDAVLLPRPDVVVETGPKTQYQRGP